MIVLNEVLQPGKSFAQCVACLNEILGSARAIEEGSLFLMFMQYDCCFFECETW